MNKQMQNSTQISKGLLMRCVIASMVLCFFSCKKKEIPVVNSEIYYTVTFESNGGAKVDVMKVKSGSTIILPASPSKDGFIFGGWYTDKETITSPFSATTVITANLILYAKWKVEPLYTVTFESNGGTKVDAIKVKSGSTITLPASPSKDGFIFGGWYTDKEVSTGLFSAITAITSDLTLYAKWNTESPYTVTFNSNGGTKVDAVTVKPGGTITLPASPSKDGFIFGGWYTDKEVSTGQFSVTTIITSDLTLYAKWTAAPHYTVTFNSNGGSAVSAITNVKKGSTITLPASPSKDGFIFDGWYTDKETITSSFSATTVITANLILYAKWTADPHYTVTFNSNGGSAVSAITNVKKGGTITLPASPSKDGFIFDGWYTDKDAITSPFSATTVITANLILYAKWTADSHYTVTFNSNGGSAVSAITNVKKGSTITLPASPSKDGFIFDGWYIDKDAITGQFSATTVITANLILYAKWTADSHYTVTFNSNGGSAVSAITNVKKGSTITLPASPSKDGFIFEGWYTDKDAITGQFSAATAITSDLTLYAKWTADSHYTVTFNSNGGSAVSAITNVKKGSTITLPASPSKDGFIFEGWYTDKDAITGQFSAATAITSDLTLYAKWTADSHYTVTFNSNGGSAVGAITNVKKGSTITLPASPSKDGFIFDGWYTDKDAITSPFSATTIITSDLTLYAKWTAVASAPLSLSSASFIDGGEILPKHAYADEEQADRLNISPQLSWANAPAGTKSFLIIMEDLDSPKYPHWTVYNIPANKTSVTEGEYNPKGEMETGNPVGNKYEGPWPPVGLEHRYQITVFALDKPATHFNETNFPVSKEAAERQLGAHILASAFIKGTFKSK